jgi:hypothetical protein
VAREHGTRNRYTTDGCRCDPCRKACSDYNRRLHYRQVNGTIEADRVWDYGDVRLHLFNLREAGIGLRSVAERSGVSRSELARIAGWERRWISQDTARAILAVPLAAPPGPTGVDATPTRLRIRSMAWLGWSLTWQATQVGTTTGVLSLIATGRQAHCTAATAEAVDALWQRHSGTFGPSASAATRARAKGWESPMAWDDDEGEVAS